MTKRVLLPSLALVALVGCGDRTAEHAAPSPSSSASLTEIPDDFPLGDAMTDPADEVPTSRTGTGLRDLTVCGASPLRGLGLRDRLVADNSGGEAAHTRELVLLGSPEEALDVARAFSDLALGCDGPEARGELSTTTEVRESSYGPGPAATLLQTYDIGGKPAPGTTIVQVVPVGSALLVSSIYGEWPAADLETAIAETGALVAGTVSAMADFGDVSTPSSLPDPLPDPQAVPDDVPDDFPLDAAMVEDGGDYTRSDPSREANGIGEAEMCGRVVWPVAGAQDRLVTHVEGPEYADSRELLVFADSDAALAAMAPVRTAYDDCRRSGNQVWTPLEEDTGWDSVTMGLSYGDGLGSSVHQVTRVGSAVLLVTAYGEGSLQSLPNQAGDVTDVTTAIAPAMCAFTSAGC